MDHVPYSYCMLLYAITCTIPGTQVNKTTPKVLDEILRNLLPPQERQGFANQAIRTTVGGDHDQEGRAAETRQDLGQVNWEMMNSLSSSISPCRIYDIYSHGPLPLLSQLQVQFMDEITPFLSIYNC